MAADAAADRGDGGGPTAWVPVHVPTATRSRCGSSSRTAAPAGPTRSTTGSSRARSTASWSARRRSRCRPTCRSATTRCGPAAATTEAAPHLVVTPGLARPPRARCGERRAWGFATQLYSVRSRRLLGRRRPHRPGRPRGLVGQRARRRLRPGQPAARRRAGARRWSRRRTCRRTRRFVNPIYLRVEGSPSTPTAPAERAAVDELRRALPPRLAPHDPIDRDAVVGGEARRAARSCHAVPRTRRAGSSASRRTAAARATACSDFATWCALAEEHGADWRDVAGRAARPDAPAVARPSRASTPTEVDFHCWLQWVLDEQLAAAQATAARAPAWRSASCTTSPSACTRERRRRVGAAGRLRAGRHGRRAAGPVQPARARTGASRRGARTGWPSSATQPFRDLIARRAAARRRRAGRPRHRAVPAVVDPGRAAGRRGHLRPLRPRGA